MDKSKKEVVYTDFPLTKSKNFNGEISIYNNDKALAQAIKMFLSSSYKEKVRSRSGGVLIPFIGKTMTEEVANEIKKRVVESLENEFYPNMTVNSIQVEGDKTRNIWIIYLTAYNLQLNLGVNDKIVFSNS